MGGGSGTEPKRTWRDEEEPLLDPEEATKVRIPKLNGEE